MSTRFAPFRPRAAYIVKLRWVVGGLCGIILVLVGTLFGVVYSGKEKESDAAVPPPVAVAAVSTEPQIEILSAAKRIEADTPLLPELFNVVTLPENRIPEGAVLAKNADSLIGTYARGLINVNIPITVDQISRTKPFGLLERKIPAGYRAVPIKGRVEDLVAGWAGPTSRVDVLYTYTDPRRGKLITRLVQASQILAVGGETTPQAFAAKAASLGDTTVVTLLVMDNDAIRINLAKETGSLSLILLGDTEIPGQNTGETGSIGQDGLINVTEPQAPEPAPEGTMVVRDETGREITYEYSKGKWRRRL